MDRTGIRQWITWCVVWIVVCFPTPLVGAEEAVAATRQPGLLSPVQQKMRQVVSVDFKDADIDNVLLILAGQADVDIVKSPKVQGKVTAVLKDIPLGEALTNILDVNGYGYIASDNMIRVVPKDEIFEAREKMISRVYRVTYANATDVEKALKGFLSEKGSISANPGTSNIIVTDVESKIKAIDLFVEEIDRVTPQIMVEARIYDISSQDKLDLGVQWQAGTATSFGPVPPESGGTLGNQYGTLGNVVQSATSDAHATGAFSGNTSNTATSALFRIGILSEKINIDAMLRAAQEDIRAKLLANPRILVLDNQLAEIKIVEEIPYQELTETSAGGSIGTTQFREVGVELRVVPHLTRDGLIRLQLNPKFSVRTGDVLVGEVKSTIPPQPIVATRETTTTALIQDGDTVVIGGLRKQDVRQQKNKIPLLGDLPLLGALFRFEGESTVNSELVIFITPSVVKNSVLSEKEKRFLQETDMPSPRTPETRLSREPDQK